MSLPFPMNLVETAIGASKGLGPLADALRGLAKATNKPVVRVNPIAYSASPVPLAVGHSVQVINTMDSTAGDVTGVLPLSPKINDTATVKNIAGANQVTVSGNGKAIDGLANYLMDSSTTTRKSVTLVYDGTQWLVVWSYPGHAGS